MRTIKFRGKYYHGEWMYGFLQKYSKKFNSRLCICATSVTSWKDALIYQVLEETVGQFTGLYDKNGKEIYEGDIIIEKLRRARKDGERLVICFDDFEWQGKNANGATTSLSLLVEYHTIEVIGNIHDNPELLKGGTK